MPDDQLTHQLTPEKHITLIRQERFGLSADGANSVPTSLSGILHRAIEHLADGLYSEDIHFVLELIQNAEDNTYNEGVKPDLSFLLLPEDPTYTPGSSGALLIVNNEAGFQAKNVEALCDIGQSTKTKREGYIGEKGIGFKSVFQVTDRPHLYSNGYQFYFQKQADPNAGFGYIVPNWLPNLPSEVQEKHSYTCILLPLIRGKYDEVARQLSDIAPETILFLSRLNGLNVHIDDNITVEVIRDTENWPLVQFMVGEQYTDFWVGEQEYAVPSDLEEPKREGVITRKVSVAFTLTEDTESEASVFAFLPTRVISGLPFLINADFVLPASRENIHTDRPWNQWLRDCIAPTFVEAFEQLLLQNEYRFGAYGYIPLSGDIQEDFFKPTVEAIHSILRAHNVIWTLTDPEPLIPENTRLAHQAFRKLLDPGNLPNQLSQTPLVHPELERYKDQLHAIGVKDLSGAEMLACLRDTKWLDTHDTTWFARLYDYLSQLSWATSAYLKPIRLVLLEGEPLGTTAEQPIYFPTAEAAEILRLQGSVPQPIKIGFLNSKLYQAISSNQRVLQWLTNNLGVKQLTAAAYCVDLARLLAKHRTDLTPPQFLLLSAFIRDHLDEVKDTDRKIIKEQLPLLVVGEQLIPPQQWTDEEPLVTPQALDPESGWQIIFADAGDRAHLRVLSDSYLAGCMTDEIKRWRTMFGVLGATDGPYPTPITWDWTDNKWRSVIPEAIGRQAHVFLGFNRQSSRHTQTIHDWLPFGWLKCLDNGQPSTSADEKRGVVLLRWLDRLRQKSNHLKFCQADHKWYHYRWYSSQFESEFAAALRNACWFPSTRGLKKPSEVFLDKPELRELFGNTLPYAHIQPTNEVTTLLSLRQSATADELLTYLSDMASQPAANVDHKLVEKIYLFLAERWRDDLRTVFEEKSLILCQKPHPAWVALDQAIWPDLSSVFGDLYVYLEGQYDKRFRTFFVQHIGTPDQLDDQVYANAWRQLAELEDPDPVKVEAALEHIYPRLLSITKVAESPEWWGEFCDDTLVWTQSNEFIPAQHVYIPDDGDLKRLFTAKGVEFAWRPEKASFFDYQSLYSALEVHSLSARTSSQPEQFLPASAEGYEPLLTSAAKLAICYYLWNTMRSVYDRAKQSGLVADLLRTDEQPVTHLVIHHNLDSITVEEQKSTAYWHASEQRLYCSLDSTREQLEIEVPSMIARRFVGGRSSSNFEDFVGRIIGASRAKVDQLLQKQNWSIPDDELSWIEQMLANTKASPNTSTEQDIETAALIPTSADQSNQQIAQEGEAGDEIEIQSPDTVPSNNGVSKPEPVSIDTPSSPPIDTLEPDAFTSQDGDDTSVSNDGQNPDGSNGTLAGATPPPISTAGQDTDKSAPGANKHPTGQPAGGGGGGGSGSRQPGAGTDHSQRNGQSANGKATSSDGSQRGRFATYVEHDKNDASHESSESESYDNPIDKAGIEHVLEFERRVGRRPISLAHNHPGYDIDSYDQFGSVVRYIEVKSIAGTWGERGVGLTDTQFNAARTLRESYWLYVVERANHDDYEIIRIQDPANKVTNFYYDRGWRVSREDEISEKLPTLTDQGLESTPS